jgi:PAS domain S-box-containing protein
MTQLYGRVSIADGASKPIDDLWVRRKRAQPLTMTARHQPRQGLKASFAVDGLRKRLGFGLGRAILFAVLLLALPSASAWTIWLDYRQAVRDTERQSQALVHALDEHIVRTITEIDQILMFLKAAYEAAPESFDLLDPRFVGVIPTGAAYHFGIVGSDGLFRTSTAGPMIRIVDFTGQEHFAAHMTRDNGALHISRAAIDPLSGRWTIDITRRLNTRYGQFAGVVMASLDTAYFNNFFRSINVGWAGRLTIAREDGVILATEPFLATALGQDLRKDKTFAALLQQSPVGTYWARETADGVPRITSYRKLANLPLIVSLGVSCEEALAQWKRASWEKAIATAMAVLLIGVLIYRLQRQFAALRAAATDLQAGEARKRAIVTTALDAVIVFDHEGHIIEFNPAAERTFGYSAHEAIGKIIYELIIPTQNRETHRRGIARFLATGESRVLGRRFEISAIRADGSQFPVELAVTATRIEGNVFFTAYLRDITDRRQAELALRKSESRYALAARGANEGLFEWDLTGGRFHFSPRFLDIVGDAVENIPVGFVLFDADDRLVMCNRRYREALAPVSERFVPGTPFEDIIRLIAESGRYADTSTIGIDEYVRRRVTIHRQNKERGEGTEVHRLSDGRWIENREYRTPDGGMVLIRTDVAAAEDLQRNPDGWLGSIHPDDSSRVRSAFDRFITSGEATISLEYRIRRSDGRERWVQLTAAIERDDNGHGRRIAGSLGDITDHKQSEEALRRTQKMEAIGRLTGGISHDFNNLLSIIIGNLDILRDGFALQEAARAKVESALKAALRGAKLTKRLLAASRQLPTAQKVSNINGVVQSMQDILARALTSEIAIETHLAPDLWLAEIDAGDLEDTVLNLAINARDAMPKGGRFAIETSNRVLDAEYAKRNPGVVPGEYVLLAVSDSGVGMSKATLDRVFEPFFTTKPAGQGTGLGLSMVYGFVKRSRGHIAIYSEVGYGTTVRIYLPRSAGSVSRTTVVFNDEEPLPRGTETILVVDDEADLRKLAVDYLADLGYRTLAAENAARALEVLDEADKIDLLFTDVLMPGGMNGYDLAQRAMQQRPGLKILLTSGFTRHSTDPGMTGLSSGLLAKPFRKTELAHRVREVLASASSQGI